ncbi:immunoglobulin lambda-1 light chain, partial [Protobothrops mucrosquamatus]|uniref:immunoglobulin lambda-1 light chain n=1 Tax=Protobothrops mucrosquamatus TaxID=103944 RepID=UPI0010FB8D75
NDTRFLYSCASLWYVFGGGTELTVTGQPTVSPSVQVFAPSPEEIRSPNPHTVVCLVSGFYPRGLEVQWKCDGKVKTSGVETTKAAKQGDKYLASSYLKLNASDYENYDTFTCQVRHEGKTIVKSVSKSGSCISASSNIKKERAESVVIEERGRFLYGRMSLWFLFGGGTQLTVTGQPTVSPTLNVYIPSEKEITNPRTPVLVCLISNFYPPGFTLKWKGDNNQEIASGVETTKASKQGDKYVASSYLTMSPSDYESHDSYTCEVRHGENTHVKTVLRSGSC